MKKYFVLGALVCLVVVFTSTASATTVVETTIEEQIIDAKAIARGRCVGIESRRLGNRIFTYVTFDVSEVLKGPISQGRLVIKQSGGAAGDFGEWISGSPQFRVGTESLVFLSTDEEGALVVQGLFLGHFWIQLDSRGMEWMVRDDGGEGVAVFDRPDVSADAFSHRRSLEEFRTLARAIVSKAPREDPGAVFQVPFEYDRPFEGESEVHPSFVLFNNQRWFEPDDGVSVPFYVNPNNFLEGATTPSLSDAVTDALAAWSNIDGCSLRLVNAGIDASGCGWAPTDGESRISIDCRNEITGSGCRSVIAIGGGHYTRSTTIVVNDTTFYKIFEADVVLQEGFCDLFQNPTALREVLTHEIGHCIGLGHSNDHDANMAPFVHNDGRGATLTEDDKAGARFIYPGSNGGGGGGEVEPNPPAILTATLPDGRVGTPYVLGLEVADGQGPFVWTVTNGALPSGVSLATNGTLVGVPSASGTYGFTVTVRDALDREAGKPLSLKVRVPLPEVSNAFYKKNKKRLTIQGRNFALAAEYEINGKLVQPKKPPVYDPASGTLVLKGSRKKLNLNKREVNQIVVIVDGERSQPYYF